MFKLEEATIADIQAAVATKEISCKELTLMYMERITSIDSNEGGLNSVCELNPDALAIAQFLDDERMKGSLRGPLHSVPILLKDNINTGDKMTTSAGSLALGDNYPYMDADIARNLRECGALVLGKTNMTEMSNWMAEDMPCGYSSRGGQVLNPYNREAPPRGSSSGSAVAVTANLCAASVGTETHGSIIGPAIANGVVGIKPTAGLFSNAGIVPISSTLDTPGPMARTVRDAAVMLGGMQNAMGSMYAHATFLVSSWSPGGYHETGKKDYTAGLENTSIRGLRFGLYGGAVKDDDEYGAAFKQALDSLANAGAAIMENIPDILPESPWDYIGNHIALHEFRHSFKGYMRLTYMGKKNAITSLEEVIEFNKANPKKCLKYGQSVLEDCLSKSSGRLVEAEYITALRRRETAIKDFDKIFTENNLDVLIDIPENAGIAPMTGFPCGTIPFATRKNNVPMGLYFIARRNDESTLLRVMHAAEQLIGNRRAPVV